MGFYLFISLVFHAFLKNVYHRNIITIFILVDWRFTSYSRIFHLHYQFITIFSQKYFTYTTADNIKVTGKSDVHKSFKIKQ